MFGSIDQGYSYARFSAESGPNTLHPSQRDVPRYGSQVKPQVNNAFRNINVDGLYPSVHANHILGCEGYPVFESRLSGQQTSGIFSLH